MKRTIIFDFFRTLYDPTTGDVYHGVQELLKAIVPERRLVLWTRSVRTGDQILDLLGVSDYFDAIHYVRVKTPETLAQMLERERLSPAECIMVGDERREEIAAAHAHRMETVWIRQDGADNTPPQPDHTVGSIDELRALLAKLT